MEDNQIVEMYFNRNQNAIQETNIKYGKYCHSIAYNILNDLRDSEECVNDTWLQAWNSIPPHHPDVMSAFLGKITRNLSLNRLMSQKALKRGAGQVPLALHELEECVSGSNTDETDEGYITEVINDFLEASKVRDRKIFVCRYWYMDSVADISRQFGITESNTGAILHRMRTRLRNYLIDRGIRI